MSSSDDYNPAAIGGQSSSSFLSTSTESRFLMHSSASSASAPESRNGMRLSYGSTEELGIDEMAIVFSFLPYYDIMSLRRVCKTWRDAAKKTLVPLTRFEVNSVRSSYNAMRAMSTALPNLQQISLRYLVSWHKYSDGEDPDERRARLTANWATHDIDIISRFSKLRILDISGAPLNGRYPFLFNFPLLQKLTIWHCRYLKWDLDMLEGLPSLKELDCNDITHLTGSLGSLGVLNDTLEKVEITDCDHVRGNFMDLADFSRLKELDLRSTTNVRGDIRDIGEHDFPALESLFLPESVHGGWGFEIQHIADMHEFMRAIHLLLRRSLLVFEEYDSLSSTFDWRLSRDSPDWYACRGRGRSPKPPLRIHFFQAGSRRGWSWCTGDKDHSCEINWLDPEPSSESSDYEAYIEELQHIERRVYIDFYRGYLQPPTEEEYHRLCEGLRDQF